MADSTNHATDYMSVPDELQKSLLACDTPEATLRRIAGIIDLVNCAQIHRDERGMVFGVVDETDLLLTEAAFVAAQLADHMSKASGRASEAISRGIASKSPTEADPTQ